MVLVEVCSFRRVPVIHTVCLYKALNVTGNTSFFLHKSGFFSKCTMTTVADARSAALWGLFIGDAMAMPVHWYYRPGDIKKDYGQWLAGYTAPKDKHPSSILNHSATDSSGRSKLGNGRRNKGIVGNVILHDKLKYWQGKSNVHYHQGMKAGENTLNAITAFETLKLLKKLDPDVSKDPRQMRKSVMANYVRFMTTPNSHNDTYAESFHRLFFRDLLQKDFLETDSETLVTYLEERYQKVTISKEDDQIPSIGGLVIAIPWILHYSEQPIEECVRHTLEALKLTHPAPSIMDFVDIYTRLLHSVINGADLKTQVLYYAGDAALSKQKVIEKFSAEASRYERGSEARLHVYQEAVGVLGMACYIQGAISSMMFLAHEFADDFSGGVLTNVNCGGENVHRGAALAALLAVNHVNKGGHIPGELQRGLVMHDKLLALVK